MKSRGTGWELPSQTVGNYSLYKFTLLDKLHHPQIGQFGVNLSPKQFDDKISLMNCKPIPLYTINNGDLPAPSPFPNYKIPFLLTITIVVVGFPEQIKYLQEGPSLRMSTNIQDENQKGVKKVFSLASWQGSMEPITHIIRRESYWGHTLEQLLVFNLFDFRYIRAHTAKRDKV